MTKRDYSKAKYAELCTALKESGYRSQTVLEYLCGDKASGKRVILRHDVDRAPITALGLAEVEKGLGYKSTFYFRLPATWDKKIISEIASMGHEIGLHYECVDKAKGDLRLAVEILKADIASARGTADVRTAAMHGNPASRFSNFSVWEAAKPGDVGLLGEAYLDVDFEKILYYSDTGRNWIEGKDNVYDHVPSAKKNSGSKMPATDTDSLISIIKKETRDLYILTHPERWPATYPGWLLSTAKDLVANPMKRIFRAGYNLNS